MERAWNDLARSGSSHFTRNIAILLVEGLRDDYFRQLSLTRRPQPLRQYDFGRPECFVSLKQRAKQELKSVKGITRALTRLLDVRKWPKIWELFRRKFC